MAQAAPSFEQYLQSGPRPIADNDASRNHQWWLSWESWLTFALVVLVQLPVVGSLQSSDWVDEMPSLLAPAVFGLLAAWLLGHTRLPGVFAVLGGIGVGIVTTTALVMQSMQLADPAASGLLVRWDEFRFRLYDWGYALLNEGISTDPLPFVTLLVGSVFLVAFVSTWAVVRWRNPWIALVPGGFVLLTNISYLPGQPSFSFVVFVLAAVLLVARLTYLRAADGWRRDGVAPNDLMSVEVLFAGGVVAVILIAAAWLIPTANNWGPVADTWERALSPVTSKIDQVGQVFIGVGSKKNLPVHALGGALPLQGEVTLKDEVLFEIFADQEMNLRGAVYDEYTGTGWRVSSAAALELSGTTVDAAQLGTPSSRAAIREPLRIDVTVVGEGAPSALLNAGDPITTDAAARMLLDNNGSPLALVPDEGSEPGTTYTTVGTVSVAAIDTLQNAGTTYPSAVYARYTSLPADLPPEVAALAAEVSAGATNPYDAARLIEQYLRENYSFTYETSAAPARRDAVAHFLFDEKRGYFDQFSSAMVVMLRTQGVPARVSAGFALDDSDLDPTTKAYMVTEQSAWTWPEVYFPGLGWVEFNPTPSRNIVIRPGDDAAARAAAESAFGGISTEVEIDAFLEAEANAAGPTPIDPSLLGGNDDSGLQQLIARIVGWTMIALTLLLAVAGAARVWWERRFRGLSKAEKRWGKTMQFARVAGLRPGDDRTAVEAADELGQRVGEPLAMRSLARSFSAHRYGGPAVEEETDSEAKSLDEAYRTVRTSLRRMIVRRITHAGRVDGGPLPRGYASGSPGR